MARLKRISIIAALLAATASTAFPAVSTPHQRHSRFRSGDLVVRGFVTPQSYEALDEWGISGMITAKLRVTDVVRGRVPSKTLTVRYIAHGDLRTDKKFRFHLRRLAPDLWLICVKPGEQGYHCS